MDTTSWRKSVENMALWIFVTKAEAIFHVSRSNNHEVAEKMLGKHSGTDIHDRYSAFDTLASKTHNWQQYCWSHIICDARELESFYGDEDRAIKEFLQRMWIGSMRNSCSSRKGITIIQGAGSSLTTS